MYQKLIHKSIQVLFSIILYLLKTINKTIGHLCKLENILPRPALLTIYKTFVRPHLDYGGILCEQAYSASFHKKLELLKYNTCLAITGAIEALQRKSYMKNQVWSPLNYFVGTANYLVFTNSSTMNILIINIYIITSSNKVFKIP